MTTQHDSQRKFPPTRTLGAVVLRDPDEDGFYGVDIDQRVVPDLRVRVEQHELTFSLAGVTRIAVPVFTVDEVSNAGSWIALAASCMAVGSGWSFFGRNASRLRDRASPIERAMTSC